MSNKKEKRKQIIADLKKKAKQEFENNLPTSRNNFTKLFNHLDAELNDKDCDHTNSLSKLFLSKLGVPNIEEVLEWLTEKGGYCDCEILANVEEEFE